MLRFVAMARSGRSFLTAGPYTPAAGRNHGLPSTRHDVAFAHDRLLDRDANVRIAPVCVRLALRAAILTI